MKFNKIIDFVDKVEDKINIFFSWINKEPETPLEGIMITLVAFGMFIGLLVLMGLVVGL